MSDISDAIADLEPNDPLRLVIDIEKRLRPTTDTNRDVDVVLRYHLAVKHACKVLGVEFGVETPETVNYVNAAKVFELTRLEIELKQIDLLAEKVKSNLTVELDDSWRGKVHTYLAHIRPIIDQADIPQGLRDSILEKLNHLAAEVDRSRTRVQAFSEVLVELCVGIGDGANGLRPAVVLFERLVGAIVKLRNTGAPTLSLPPPEGFGLEPPEDISPSGDGPLDI